MFPEFPDRIYALYARWESARDEGTPFDLDRDATPDDQVELRRLIAFLNPAPATPEPELPAPTGRYRFAAFLARGGMGEVYRGEDTLLRRAVALKVLRRHYGISAHQFREEARLAARLSHPGIVPVHDFGELADRRPFFAMKLVEGQTFEAVLVANAGPGFVPRALQYFEQVCQAVAYAHDQTPPVLHRDLKPQNVMIGAYGEVLVMDWGIARAVLPDADPSPGSAPAGPAPEGDASPRPASESEPTPEMTRTGIAKGTWGYMSPEQARGDRDRIGPGSDVFSLGGILCRLLTGRPPYAGEDRQRQALAGDVREAYSRLDGCGADAELIALAKRCLAPDPKDRPANAGELAAAVAAYRAGVEARLRQAETERAEALVREAEQRKRRRQLILAGGVVTLTLLAGLSFSLGFLDRATRAETQARADEASAIAARDDEKKVRLQAFATLRSITEDFVQPQLDRGVPLREEMKPVLRRFIAQFDAFAAIRGDDLESRAFRAEGRSRVGLIHHLLDDVKDAGRAYGDARTIQKRLVDEAPDRRDFRQHLSRTENQRGALLAATQRYDLAEGAYRDALASQRRLVEEAPDDLAYRQELARTYNNLGNLLRDAGRPKEAEAAFRDGAATLRRVALDAANPGYRQELANCLNSLGAALSRTPGRLDEAEAAHREALAIQQQLAAEFPKQPAFRQDLAMSFTNLGVLVKRSTGRLEEAEKAYRDALAIQKELVAEFPSRPDYRSELATSLNNLSILLLDDGRPQEAEPALADALAIRKRLAEDFPDRPEFRRSLARTYNSIGLPFKRAHRPADAERAFRDALAILKGLVGDFPGRPDFRSDQASTQNSLGLLLRDGARPEEAERAFRDALATLRGLVSEHPDRDDFRSELARCGNNLGLLMREARRFKEAEELLADALSHREQLAARHPHPVEDRVELGRAYFNLGAVLHDAGRYREAERAYTDALTTRNRLAADFPGRVPFRLDQAGSHVSLGMVLRDMGRPGEAEAAFGEALKLYRDLVTRPPTQPAVQNALASACVEAATLCNLRGEHDQAAAYLAEAEPHVGEALKSAPRRPDYRLTFRKHLGERVRTHAGLLDADAALLAAERLRDRAWDPPSDAYDAASALARCLPVVRSHAKIDAQARQKAEQFYGDKALLMLRDAVRKGFRDVDRLRTDADLAPLRSRDDLRGLIAELEKAPSDGRSILP